MDIYAIESMRILWYWKRQSQVYGMVTKLNEAATACHTQGTSIQVHKYQRNTTSTVKPLHYIEKCSWKRIIWCFVCLIWDERNANQKCAGVFLWVFKDTDPKVKRSVLKYLGHLFHCSVILVIKFIHKTAKITLFFFKLKAYWEVWLSCFLSNHLLFLLRKHLNTLLWKLFFTTLFCLLITSEVATTL